jgi:hypothetical protein
LSNTEKYSQVVHNLEISIDESGRRKLILVLGIGSFMSWLKNWMCVSSSVHGFHEYFISGNCDNFPIEFQPLAAAVTTLIISTSECEPLFSTMHTTISYVQS